MKTSRKILMISLLAVLGSVSLAGCKKKEMLLKNRLLAYNG